MADTIPNTGTWDSISTTLNSNQGGNVEKDDLVNDLISTDTDKAPTANTVKTLKDTADTLATTVNGLNGVTPSVQISTTPVVLTADVLNNRVALNFGADTVELPETIGILGDTVTITNFTPAKMTITAEAGNTFFFVAVTGLRFTSAVIDLFAFETRVFTRHQSTWATRATLQYDTPKFVDLAGTDADEWQYDLRDVGYNLRLKPGAGVTALKLGDFGVADLDEVLPASSSINYYIQPVENCTIDFHADKVGDNLFFIGVAQQNFAMLAGQYYKVRIERMDNIEWFIIID